jgi:hypothetical protein
MQNNHNNNVKWIPKDNFFNNHVISNFKTLEKLILRKFQCISLIDSSFDDILFFYFYFDITLMYFLSPHFSFSLCDRLNVVI